MVDQSIKPHPALPFRLQLKPTMQSRSYSKCALPQDPSVCIASRGGSKRVATGKEMLAALRQKYRIKGGSSSVPESSAATGITMGYTLIPAATGQVTLDENGDNTVTRYDLLKLSDGQWGPVDLTRVKG